MIKVSVIVPVYNVEKYIDKCLNSLVNQTLKDIEIIVVNDGSPDNSQEIIDRYAKKYPTKVKSFIKENGGQGSARNYGLEQASGEYIGYVDSDDYVELNMYEEMYKKAKKEKSDIVICNNYLVNEFSNIKTKENNFRNIYSNIDNAFFGKMAVWNKIYKKNLLIDNNILFKEKVWYEDFAFSLKAITLAEQINYVDKYLYNYLFRQGSTMNNNNIIRNLEILDAFDDTISFLKNRGIYDKFYSYLEFLAIDHIYISSIVRVLRADASIINKQSVIEQLIKYMENNFAAFNDNKYIDTLSRNRKTIYKLLRKKHYGLVQLIFKIKKY